MTLDKIFRPERGGYVPAEEEQMTIDDHKGLLLVAVRVDDSQGVQNRIKTVLAVAATYANPPDTTAAVWCKSLPELTAADLDRLAGFIGWDRVRDLNVGDVSAEYADAVRKGKFFDA